MLLGDCHRNCRGFVQVSGLRSLYLGRVGMAWTRADEVCFDSVGCTHGDGEREAAMWKELV